jgi:hypothetical protein
VLLLILFIPTTFSFSHDENDQALFTSVGFTTPSKLQGLSSDDLGDVAVSNTVASVSKAYMGTSNIFA